MLRMVGAIKGWADGRWFARMFELKLDNGWATQNIWNAILPARSIGIRVGGSGADKAAYIQGPGVDPSQKKGTYTFINDRIDIHWDACGWEVWVGDGKKWVLDSANGLTGDKHGWAFISELPGGALDMQTMFFGEYARYNGWIPDNLPVAQDAFTFNGFAATDTGVLRRVDLDRDNNLNVFRYFAFVGDIAFYQISHDFDRDGKIDNDKGHTYAGFPLWKGGKHQGFVFADASDGGTYSALYYFRE